MPTALMTETESVARRFHAVHEQMHARAKRRDEVPWEDMPESYRKRVLTTFELMLRDSSIQPGHGLPFHSQAEPARF